LQLFKRNIAKIGTLILIEFAARVTLSIWLVKLFSKPPLAILSTRYSLLQKMLVGIFSKKRNYRNGEDMGLLEKLIITLI
jgi:hypothetical protein